VASGSERNSSSLRNVNRINEIREFYYQGWILLFGFVAGPRYHLKRRRMAAKAVLLLLYGQCGVAGHVVGDFPAGGQIYPQVGSLTSDVTQDRLAPTKFSGAITGSARSHGRLQ
jgi:hypothetical protein